MKRRNRLKWLGKIVLSGTIAFIILTGFCMLYYNVPVRSFCKDGATDYVWEPNSFYSIGTEGFAWGKTNNEGYFNSFDYEEEMLVDVLVMGSSHMEAGNVAMPEKMASKLGDLLPEETIYNIGTSGHDFLKCANNLSAAVQKYRPAKYVIIETGNISFSEDSLKAAINHEIAIIPSHSEGLVRFLQRNQFLRLMYAQLSKFLDKGDSRVSENPTEGFASKERSSETNLELFEILLSQMAETVDSLGAKIVIVYHPGTSIDQEGGLQLSGNKSLSGSISVLCEENGILYLDMSERFSNEYADNYILPHGFINSSVGSGHLNKYGHAMIAEELYKLISEVE